MTTISNNKLPEWRKALNSAVENYQSAQSWYEENQDSPSAGQDMDAAEGEIEKLAINKARQWPEPKDGEPRLHIKAQPAPVVPDGLRQALSNAGIAAPESDEMLAATCEKYIQMLVTWVKDRKPFQPVPVVPEEITDESTEQRLMGRRWAHSFCAGWNACRAAMLKGDAK